MKRSGIHIVIGKNFGDEGKGLAVDYFAMRAREEKMPCLVIRHNGGAQAGHTVDLRGNRPARFVFHQLSAGAFRGADTYWADTFLPDLYKLPEEMGDFADVCGQLGQSGGSRIFADASCRCVCVDDVLLNMAIETVRGAGRHGSCGMGINEAVLRSAEPDHALTLGEIQGGSAQAVYEKMKRNRKEYLPMRLSALCRELRSANGTNAADARKIILDGSGEFGELLQNDNVLAGAAEAMCRAAQIPVLTRPGELLPRYGEWIFEGAQGLLLDEKNAEYAPHLTSSRTGLHNPADFVRKHFPALARAGAEAVYVSRTYVTRHGAGPLPYEGRFGRSRLGDHQFKDRTNIPNRWQGTMRFAPHGTPEEFVRAVRRDLDENGGGMTASLFLTHIGETGGMILTADGGTDAGEWCLLPEIQEIFDRIYCSKTPYAEDVSAQERRQR